METLSERTTEEKINLLGLSPKRMVEFFESLGEKSFRARQVLQWIHQSGVDDFDQMTNISKALRAKLKDIAEITCTGNCRTV